jgi:hypothetical protein
MQPAAVQQAAYYASAAPQAPVATQVPPGAVVQTVQITPLTANMVQPSAPTVAAGDGFRPRGSMR